MIRSMTGYGRASLGSGKYRCSVEIRSVNHRYFDYSARLPQALLEFENPIKQIIHSHIKRGRVTLSLVLNGDETSYEQVRVDEDKVKFYHRSLTRVASKLGMDRTLRINDIIQLPGIFVFEKKEPDVRAWWPLVRRTAEKALRKLLLMKQSEGNALRRDFVMRLKRISKGTIVIRERSQGQVLAYRKRLTKRIEELTGGLSLDEEKLLKEVALYAEKSDITEELVRLTNHVKLFRSTLDQKEEIGKRLDFIMQEMNREANTIASKSMDFKTSSDVVRIKSEIEKIREQVQNVE